MSSVFIFPPNRATLNSGSLATASNQTTIIGELQRSVNGFMDIPFLDTSVTNIPASASNSLQVVNSLAAACKEIRCSDTTGSFIGIYTGPVATPTLVGIIQPGDDGIKPLRLAAGTKVSLRNLENAVINSGDLTLEFIG
jgi:hypothetical protein